MTDEDIQEISDIMRQWNNMLSHDEPFFCPECGTRCTRDEMDEDGVCFLCKLERNENM